MEIGDNGEAVSVLLSSFSTWKVISCKTSARARKHNLITQHRWTPISSFRLSHFASNCRSPFGKNNSRSICISYSSTRIPLIQSTERSLPISSIGSLRLLFLICY
ncbi:hypothetical protein L6452_22553 [Arctium lappa]|uniref:Uncharacterized protein n=1 Tax=Arctium lappa TaxID=4217 RepID=A0ACB9AZ93_ARCLA|nr:hypothetical protein L6452_22553 [Arctium lappa]